MVKQNISSKEQLQEAEKQFDKFSATIADLTKDRLDATPLEQVEPQTKLSTQEMKKSTDHYLKPIKAFPPGQHPKTGKYETFNEKFRSQWEFDKQYVRFVAENHEIIGETIDLWTKPYPGVNMEEWLVPTNKPVWGPRYLAEQIKRRRYHRLVMQDSHRTGNDFAGTYVGAMVADITKQRLDAHSAPDTTQFSFNQRVSSF